MTEDRNYTYPGTDQDETCQNHMVADAALPDQLVGSRMERERYLDNVVNEILMSSQLPQSRS